MGKPLPIRQNANYQVTLHAPRIYVTFSRRFRRYNTRYVRRAKASTYGLLLRLLFLSSAEALTRVATSTLLTYISPIVKFDTLMADIEDGKTVG